MRQSQVVPFPVRSERPARILDAAGTLLLRWGFARVTMDDIAREAYVGTGTLYLHWKTKEALFETVVLCELHALWGELAQQIRSAPSDAVLHRCLPLLFRAVKQRPLARALFTRDIALLGKLAHRPLLQQSQHLLGADSFLIHLRQLGLLRDDVDIALQAHAFGAIWTGFVLIDTLVQPEHQVRLEIQLDALAETIRRLFEPDPLPDPAIVRDQVAPQIISWFEQMCDSLARQIVARTIG